jgi:L-amino acid N-acyltransferase YncA
MRHQRFVSRFVGELYVILIGIGIANVILRQQIDLTKWIQIVLAVFVTVIVSLYWWDWAAYVEKYFLATPVEFAIDFACLIVLEFLFVHFKEPVRLAWNFLALGVVDLIWVINHIWQRPEQTFSIRRRWVLQKILGLAIYGGGLSLVLFMHNKGFGIERLGASVILTAFLVRWLCFREVRRIYVATFRAAHKDDTPRIVQINRDYIDTARSDAFLLESLSEREVRSLRGESPARLFVAVRGSTILGYAKVSNALDESILSSLTWLDPLLATSVRNGKILHIEHIAVDPRHVGKGIGRSFYEWLMRRQPKSVPCAFVALTPRCNASSLRFHASLGFEKAAIFRRGEFLGQNDYQSLLLVRPLRMSKPPEYMTKDVSPGNNRTISIDGDD